LKLRTALAPVLAAAALTVPSAAEAAGLSVDRRCYGPGERVLFTGTGFTPNGQYALSTGGQQLGLGMNNAVGEFELPLAAPQLSRGERRDPFTATDQTDLTITASTEVRLTALDVTVKPKRGNPGIERRIKARGFTRGKKLFAHVKQGSRQRNVEVGRLRKPCGVVSAKRRIFSSNAKTGVYQVQFDAKRKYSPRTAPQVTFLVTVFQTFEPASASAFGVGETWTRLD
jgi:hypothetical protein